MTQQAFLEQMNSGRSVAAGLEVHRYMYRLSREAIQLTAGLNKSYHTPEEIRGITKRLTVRPIDPGFNLFPLFYTY